MDIDEIMAFAAPRFTELLEGPAVRLTRAGAWGINKLRGATAVSGAQAARAGAALATGGGVAVVAGGIYYACVATQEAHEGMVEARAQRAAWQGVLGADGQGVAGLARAAGLAPAAQARLNDLAQAQAQRQRLNVIGKAAAAVGSALMAATLLFSAEFVVSWALPALVELGHACMGVAIPAMALYGLLSAYNATRALVLGLREQAALRRHLAKQPDAVQAALAPHLKRHARGLCFEAATALGGVGLAVGLVLQVQFAAVGLLLLAAGTFSLEGFTFARNITLGALRPQALRQQGRQDLLRGRVQTLVAAMNDFGRAERALASARPGRMASLRGAWLRLRGQSGAEALRARLAHTFAQLAPVHRAFLPNGGSIIELAQAARLPQAGDLAAPRPEGGARRATDAVGALFQLDLFPQLSERLMADRSLAAWAEAHGCVHVHDTDAPDDVADCYGRWHAALSAAPLGEAAQAAIYRAVLETLWSEGAEQMLRRYGEARAVSFARLAAGERY